MASPQPSRVVTRDLSLWAFRAATAVSLAAVIGLALQPPGQSGVFLLGDKANHALSFYILALLLTLSMKRPRFWAAAAGLLVVGAAIEAVQSLPVVGRRGDWLDLVADGLGIALAYLPMWVARLRSPVR